jgi:hypothetical protein
MASAAYHIESRMNNDLIKELAKQAGAEFAELPMMDAIVFPVDDRNWNSKCMEMFVKLVEDATILRYTMENNLINLKAPMENEK